MDQALTHPTARPTGQAATPYAALSFDICELLAGLGNPAQTPRLTPEQHRQAKAALDAARAEALERADTQPFAGAQQCLVFAQALSAAMATLDLVHSPA